MTQAYSLGLRNEFVAGFWPKWYARTGPLTSFAEKMVGMWVDLQVCLKFPSNRNFGLTSTQMSSLYKQLVCHIVFGIGPLGGNKWDLEARRSDIPWHEVYIGKDRCNWD